MIKWSQNCVVMLDTLSWRKHNNQLVCKRKASSWTELDLWWCEGTSGLTVWASGQSHAAARLLLGVWGRLWWVSALLWSSWETQESTVAACSFLTLSIVVEGDMFSWGKARPVLYPPHLHLHLTAAPLPSPAPPTQTHTPAPPGTPLITLLLEDRTFLCVLSAPAPVHASEQPPRKTEGLESEVSWRIPDFSFRWIQNELRFTV